VYEDGDNEEISPQELRSIHWKDAVPPTRVAVCKRHCKRLHIHVNVVKEELGENETKSVERSQGGEFNRRTSRRLSKQDIADATSDDLNDNTNNPPSAPALVTTPSTDSSPLFNHRLLANNALFSDRKLKKRQPPPLSTVSVSLSFFLLACLLTYCCSQCRHPP
jgi:hypothetical protein